MLTLIDPAGHQLGRAVTDAHGDYAVTTATSSRVPTGVGLFLARGHEVDSSAPVVVPVSLAGGAVHDVVLAGLRATGPRRPTVAGNDRRF